MQLKEFNLMLDIKKYRKNEEIEIVQGDFDTNIINITLYDGLNVYSLDNLNIEIAFAKSDGTTVLQGSQDEETPIAIAGNKIICTLKTNTIAVAGKVLAEVRILDNDRLLTSSRFEFYVRKAIVNDESVQSTNEFPILNAKIKEVDDLIEEIQNMEVIKGDDGKNAYEVWLEAGNTGTVEDYLASLKGETPSIEHLENAVDNKLAEVDEVITLGTSTNTSLIETIDTANDKLLELDGTVVNANIVNENLNTSIVVGGNINSSLESNMAEGNNINQILDDKIIIATNKKGELEDSINTANTTKTGLDNSISEGSILKEELEDIIAGTDLEQVITDINSLKKDQHSHINKNVLDKLSDDNGVLKYDGQDVGSGDMEKEIYDTNNNGKVDMAEDSEKLGGHEPSYYASKTELNNMEQKSKDYADQQITLVTETGIPKLNVYEYKFNNVDIGTTEIQIPLITFDKQTDIVKLYINAISRDSDFFTIVDTIRDEEGNLLENAKVVLNKALTDISKVTIEIWKNIPIGDEGSVSGSVISIDSMPQNRVQGLNNLNEKVNTIDDGKVNKSGDIMTGKLRFAGSEIAFTAPDGVTSYTRGLTHYNKDGTQTLGGFGLTDVEGVKNLFLGVGENPWSTDSNIRFYADKTQVIKPLEENFTAVIVNSQQEFDNYVNTVSLTMEGDTYYKHSIQFSTFILPLNAGGRLLLEGHKTTLDYQWQKLTSYQNTGVEYFRSCNAGVWTEWSQMITSKGGIFAGEIKHGRNLVTQPKLKDYSEINTILFPESNTVIDLSKGNVFELIPDKGVTLSITNSSTTSSTNCHSFTLIITMQSPVYPIIFPSSIKWVGDNPPDLTKPNREYYLTFVGRTGVSKWAGMFGGDTVVG
ncbi:hypothetical protein [Tissierella sp.]|uniref:pyocin knob domain-containing protein n=1 Tax=Tissierella sp. TaxID=41274 RepID=UPI003026EEE2